MATPDRKHVEDVLGQKLLDWQWNALLGMLGHLPTKVVAPPAPAKRPDGRDKVQRTCELCGRVGTRRFIVTPTSVRCSPSATACIGNQPEPVRKIPNPALAHDLDANESDHAEPTPPPRPPHSDSPDLTARCQDCTRTWNLTGRILQSAVEMHELKHGHIVTILGEREAG